MTGFDQAELRDREKLRAELGYEPDERVCVVTVGGSGVGGHLLRKVMAAFPAAKKLVPELRMVVVAGPPVDLSTLPEIDWVEVHAYAGVGRRGDRRGDRPRRRLPAGGDRWSAPSR